MGIWLLKESTAPEGGVECHVGVKSHDCQMVIGCSDGEYLAVVELSHLMDEVESASQRERLHPLGSEGAVERGGEGGPCWRGVIGKLLEGEVDQVGVLLSSACSEVSLVIGGDGECCFGSEVILCGGECDPGECFIDMGDLPCEGHGCVFKPIALEIGESSLGIRLDECNDALLCGESDLDGVESCVVIADGDEIVVVVAEGDGAV